MRMRNFWIPFMRRIKGDPLTVAKSAIAMREKYASTACGWRFWQPGRPVMEKCCFHAHFSAETHAVETVLYARAAAKYTPDATFLLDIGGQDMKAIWLDNGVITNIVVNEACSSGCGSFLENFASSCIFRRGRLLKRHFLRSIRLRSEARCTVFMTSSIVTEQRNGKLPEDIMAGAVPFDH